MSQAQERCHITVSQPINLHKLETWQWSQELLWIHDFAIATGGTRSITLMFTLPIQRVFAPTLTATKKRHLKVQFPEQRKNPYTWKFSYKFTGGRGSDPHRERRWQENAPEGALWCPQLTDVLVNLAHHPILSPPLCLPCSLQHPNMHPDYITIHIWKNIQLSILSLTKFK